MKLEITKNSPIQYQIADYIKKHSARYKQSLAEEDIIEICNMCFKNFRISKGVPHGLRLSPLGNKYMRRWFSSHEFNLDEPIVGHVLIKLDQAMSRPYYLTKKQVTFYDDNDAAWFKLGGHDLKYFAGNL